MVRHIVYVNELYVIQEAANQIKSAALESCHLPSCSCRHQPIFSLAKYDIYLQFATV